MTSPAATSPVPTLDADAAFARYEAVRDRLPAADFPAQAEHGATLADAAAMVDGFVLDAFGVLNVGDSPIPGAVARMAALRAAGKALVVLTNAASHPRAAAVEKVRRLGFDFSADEIVSSRDVAAAHLAEIAPGATWAAVAAEGDDFHDIPAAVVDFTLRDDWDAAEAVLFLSSARWTAARQDRLVESLAKRTRPVVVANPDLVAPREGGLTVEPGYWAHDAIDRAGATPRFFGKPFGPAFAEAARRAGGGRLAMVGDTLHTDILGGRAAGMRTVLVADHGLFAGRDVARYVRACGVTPDLIIPTP